MPKPTEAPHIPKRWIAAAHEAWLRGERQQAIDMVLAPLNSAETEKTVDLFLQLSYYVFLCGDPAAAARFLARGHRLFPDHAELQLNLGVCLYRSGQLEAALPHIQQVLAKTPDDITALDGLCSILSKLNRLEEASQAGTRVLELKDRAAVPPRPGWRLPGSTPDEWAAMPGKRPVVAFSLWGTHRRYLHGALDNALALPQVYPGWTPVYFVDDSVPSEIRAKLVAMGAEIRVEASGQAVRQKLAWRFKVANDPAVGRFLVRDVDSVVGERERAAVGEWVASGRWFHVMRDWWTHTDLMLAGMWGGVAGVLPDLTSMLGGYKPRAAETPNVDQWFLRDRVWGYVRASCLVHDRCFSPAGAQRWPQPDPPGSLHVGQNEHAVRAAAQQERVGGLSPAR